MSGSGTSTGKDLEGGPDVNLLSLSGNKPSPALGLGGQMMARDFVIVRWVSVFHVH